MDNTNSKQYWNDYVAYWEDRVKEANDGKEIRDKTSDDAILEQYFKKLQVKPGERFLDYGCGSGRLYPIYKRAMGGTEENRYFGIDVSEVSLEHACRENKDLEMERNLKEFDGLHIPFPEKEFDKIICFGVFDACSQEFVIRELLRVLKTGGRVLITGKNNRYFEEDQAALTAEVNARKKGHPNYFTDVHNFTRQLSECNVKLLETWYFLRRGDFPENRAVKEMPEVFYEWAYLMEKTDIYTDGNFTEFSNRFSETYRRIQMG